jgi:hypothetical protein
MFEKKYAKVVWEETHSPPPTPQPIPTLPDTSEPKPAKKQKRSTSENTVKRQPPPKVGERIPWTNDMKLALADKINRLEESHLVVLVRILQNGVVKEETSGDVWFFHFIYLFF